MFNLQIFEFPNGMCKATYFVKHLISHEAYAKKSLYIPTPFADEDGNTLYAHSIVADDNEFKVAESIRCSVSRTKKRIFNIANSGNFKYFATFTFSPDSGVDRYSYSDVCDKMKKYLKKLQLICSHNLQYIVVPELHKDGAFHFHALFNSEFPCDYAGYFIKTGYTYHAKHWDYGFTVVNIISKPDRISSYISKYITKDLVSVSKGKRRYWYSHSTIHVPEPFNILLKEEDAKKLFHFINIDLGGYVYETNSFSFPVIRAHYSQAFCDSILDFISQFEYFEIE